ncbi:MAG: LysM peptidoglycan-binding domain-containing protein [Chloroflexi bacterium]|nr:LysM peptidoglycan-binding domain-containing protein [Chloroflexota bacterium]
MKVPIKFLRVMLLLLGLAVIATACVPFVGNGPDEETPTPEVIPTVIRPTQATSEAPAASPVPTLVPLPTRAPQAATAPPSCTPRTDWPTYTVQSGDTLYSIAQRSDSTQAIVQAANCLADPNKIFEGQSLRVPKQPAPREPAATPGPAATPQPGFFQATVTPGAPTATGEVEFTIIVQDNTAIPGSPGSYQARTADGAVKLGVSVTNVTSFEIVRADGYVLDREQAASGSTTAGGNFSYTKLNRAEGSNHLIFTIKVIKPDGTEDESTPYYIQWP